MTTTRTSVRSRAALALLPVVAVLMAAVGLVPAASAQTVTSTVSIVQTPSGAGGPCVPAPLGLTRTVENTAEVFRLRITAAAPPCSPIEAAAVVYAMPGSRVAWPQQLVERADFTIAEAGVTEITFLKECAAVQFEVITGASPLVISPTGEWHGPLLFPLDTGTTLQYWGDEVDCDEVTTTTSTSTTTTSEPEVLETTTSLVTSTTESPTTSEPEVLGSTTVPEVLGSTTVPSAGPDSGAPVEVLDSTATPAGLALTGVTSGALVAVGALMLVAGAVLVVPTRRRSATRD